MSIFDSIKNAIFGHKAAAAPAPAPTSAPGASPTPPPAAQAPASQPVDVEAVLNSLATKNAQKLNWRTSIVDLMKLLDLDSSITNRKALAKELGYTGNTDDSAAMNIWLHKQVMNKLAQNGGKVPADLKD
jgi:3-oxoacyl-ACP reductase-like protein